MTDHGYAEWRRYHCSLLCIHTESYEKMLEDMLPLLRRMKATVEELDAATEWMWSKPELVEKPWGAHGGILRAYIFRWRDANAKKKPEAAGSIENWINPIVGKIGKIAE